MFDEQQLKILALCTSATDAQAVTDKAAASKDAADNVLAGRRIESEQALEKRGRIAQQRARREAEAAAEKRDHVAKFFKNSSKSSIEAAATLYVTAPAEDRFLLDVLALAQQGIEDAQSRVVEAEIAAMKADLIHQEAEVVCMAIAHQAAAATVIANDPAIEEIPFGPAVVAALDRIAETVTQIAKKERGNQNGQN